MSKKPYSIKTNTDLIKAIDKFKRTSHKRVVAVGWVDNAFSRYANNEDITTPQVAVWQEFGTKQLTPTYFFSDALKHIVDKETKTRGELMRNVQRGKMTVDNALEFYGAVAKQHIQDNVRNVGLIDTGLLRRTVSHEVKNR